MSENANDTVSDDRQRPRDAATLVLVDMSAGEPRLLMGKRRPGQVFMPSKVVFPGGRVDDEDRQISSVDELAEEETEKLLLDMQGHPSRQRARAIALASIRETFEETGIVIGARHSSAGPPDIEALAGNATWRAFFDRGYAPQLSRLCYFARAITPPGRPRRYDTRFFCLAAEDIAEQTGELDEELSEINWYTIAETSELDLPPITRVIIEDLGDRLAAGPLGPSMAPIPFYHQRRGNFRRDMLHIGSPTPPT